MALTVYIRAVDTDPRLLDVYWQRLIEGDDVNSVLPRLPPRPIPTVTHFILTVVDSSVHGGRRLTTVIDVDLHGWATGQPSCFRLHPAELGFRGMPVVNVKACCLVYSVPAAAAASGFDGVDSYTVMLTGQSASPLQVAEVVRYQQQGFEMRNFAPSAVPQQHQQQSLTLNASLNEATSRLTASINWIYNGWQDDVDQWMVTINNLSWEQNDFVYHHWVFIVAGTSRNLELPLRLRHGNRYEVTVSGLKDQTPSSLVQTAAVQHFVDYAAVMYQASIQLRSGEALSKSDVQQLLQKAIQYRGPASRQLTTQFAKCVRMSRNKSTKYFDRINEAGDGLMRTYLKDPSGDPLCPINGEIKGLFFLATPRTQKGQLPKKSPFGNARFTVNAETILQRYPNVYFADFACLKGHPRKMHHVTLVLTRLGSDADRFCRDRLPQLDVNDAVGNPFLFRQGGQLLVARTAFVEVLVTEDIDVRSWLARDEARLHYGVQVVGPGTTTQGGLPKTARCPECDLFAERVEMAVARVPGGLCEF